MNTNYKNEIPTSFRMKERVNPIQEEIAKSLGTFSLTVTVEKDTEMTNAFRHIPNFIAFKTTLKKDNNIIGIGTGASVLNRLNKFLDRTVLFAKNASLVDAMIRSTKILDALSIMPINQKESDIDLEQRDSPAFYGENDLPQVATEKQLNFAKKLIENCDEDEKEQYLEQISSPYFSKFQCSELIQKLMPVK